MISKQTTRRRFLQAAGMTAISLQTTAISFGQIKGANQHVRLAIIGCGGRGTSLSKLIPELENCDIVAVCDPDTQHMEKLVSSLPKAKGDIPVRKIRDYRKLLEEKDIDGVIIASPNYWHALHSIHALQAGKAVYVEKPVSHNIWEGRQLVAAAKRYNGIITAGTQNRSDPGPQEGFAFVKEGGLGKIQGVHACCFRNRSSIGRAETVTPVPETLDYNLWLGPAQDIPMHRKSLHYDWHWVWNTGDGDMGNQAPHEIDMANWVLGDHEAPSEIRSFGGRFGWDDAGNTPNMHTAWYEQNGIPVILEVNNLWLAPDRNMSSMRDRCRVGVIVRCENGILRGGRGGMAAYEPDGRTVIKKFKGDGGENHMANFVAAIREGNGSKLAAPIDNAVRSAEIVHLANLSMRAGQKSPRTKLDEVIGGHEMLQTILSDQQKQLEAWSADKELYTLGSTLKFDTSSGQVQGDGINQNWVHSPGRNEFVVPDIS